MPLEPLALPRPPGIARRVSGLFLAGAALVALVAFLLVANYRGARTLRENLLAQHAQWIQLHVVALGGVLGGAEEDLRNLAESREVAAFFESRDLGMSPRYGLELTLVPIRERLLALCERGRAGAPPAFRRVALLDEGGGVLADSEEHGAPVWPGSLGREAGESGARLSPDRVGAPAVARLLVQGALRGAPRRLAACLEPHLDHADALRRGGAWPLPSGGQ